MGSQVLITMETDATYLICLINKGLLYFYMCENTISKKLYFIKFSLIKYIIN